ncbi:hypothetical protein SAMD00019534_102670 [Acytostelium subglobosum LB1]|uniref:hypothetical protein n=1 Tax=Acytostelium subglobosum LB1 TaxID=1410327 RepID=UPI000644DF13|nr:hypothetical protein SAMD00019534_102670 [Acytostelium subglobosum LB1]GAM27092.1 hypothetical protein SAMD00019534_102670 [Acytostelium subglobosum LB1]|eukprot:XP_012749972.1 hypothetical protein SAMD00019534_102670 [Acytostelium subglobosum LB1]
MNKVKHEQQRVVNVVAKQASEKNKGPKSKGTAPANVDKDEQQQQQHNKKKETNQEQHKQHQEETEEEKRLRQEKNKQQQEEKKMRSKEFKLQREKERIEKEQEQMQALALAIINKKSIPSQSSSSPSASSSSSSSSSSSKAKKQSNSTSSSASSSSSSLALATPNSATHPLSSKPKEQHHIIHKPKLNEQDTHNSWLVGNSKDNNSKDNNKNKPQPKRCAENDNPFLPTSSSTSSLSTDDKNKIKPKNNEVEPDNPYLTSTSTFIPTPYNSVNVNNNKKRDARRGNSGSLTIFQEDVDEPKAEGSNLARLNFLYRASLMMQQSNSPAIARYLHHRFRQDALQQGVDELPSAEQPVASHLKTCSSCSVNLVPGVNCRVRLKNRSNKLKLREGIATPSSYCDKIKNNRASEYGLVSVVCTDCQATTSLPTEKIKARLNRLLEQKRKRPRQTVVAPSENTVAAPSTEMIIEDTRETKKIKMDNSDLPKKAAAKPPPPPKKAGAKKQQQNKSKAGGLSSFLAEVGDFMK